MADAPFHYDIVGSFLRPEALKEARKAFAEETISQEQLTAAEDAAIKELVEQQKASGLKAVTDGEFRRSMWHLDFLTGLVGTEEVGAEHWSVHFQGHQPKSKTVVITDKLGFGAHPFLDHFKFTQEAAGDTLVKQTIPSPTMLHLICCVREEHYTPIERYKGNEELLFADIAAAYRDAVKAFYDAGCRYLQFDDTSWGECYDPVAPILFPNLKVDGFFLEYDSERAGDFGPLSHIADQKVVLGLVTSKDGALENPKDLKHRIEEAAKYVPLRNLCISPQCGFSSTEEGNIIEPEDQWKKIALIKAVAEEVWGK